MYKIIENNQIIDVVEKLQFVKCLAKSKRMISTDERQANGIMSSDGRAVYHIDGTPHTFSDIKRRVRYVEISDEEYETLNKQVKEQHELQFKLEQMEKLILELQAKLEGQ